MESGLYDKKKPYIPICFNKELHNNRISEDNNKHQTPLGAGMVTWANNKATLQPTT